MKRFAISVFLLLSMLCALIPMSFGAMAEGTEGELLSAEATLTYEELYVKKGLTTLLLAYDPASDGVTLNGEGGGTWQNKIQSPDGSFSQWTLKGTVARADYLDGAGAPQTTVTGWKRIEGGGIGYDMTLKQSNTGANDHCIEIDKSALPAGEYTLQIIMSSSGLTLEGDEVPRTSANREGFWHEKWSYLLCFGNFSIYSKQHIFDTNHGVATLDELQSTYGLGYWDGGVGQSHKPIYSTALSGTGIFNLNVIRTYPDAKNTSVTVDLRRGAQNVMKTATLESANVSVENGSIRLVQCVPGTVYAIRIYNRALTEEELFQNHFADLAAYYGFDLSLVAPLNEKARASLYEQMALVALGGDAEEANRIYLSAIEKASYVPSFNQYDELYVKNGLTLLMTAYGGENEKTVSLVSGGGTWYNKIQKPDGSYAKYNLVGTVVRADYLDESGAPQTTVTGWKYAEGGGIGYDMTMKQTIKHGDLHYIEIDTSEVPAGEYTLQVIMSSSGLTLEGDETPRTDAGKEGFRHERWGYLLRFGNYSIYSKQHIFDKSYGTATLDELQTTYGLGYWDGGVNQAHKPIYNTALSGTGVFNLNLVRTYPDAENTTVTLDFPRDALSTEIAATMNSGIVDVENGTIRLMQSVPGTVYAIRIYDRQLTEDEMIQNHFADLCAYYQLDLSLFTTFVPEASRGAVYRQWAKYTFDSHTKEDLQRQLDESISATFVKFDGFSVKTEGVDNEFAAIFTVNEAKIQEYLALNYTIEYGVLMAKENVIGSINELVYGVQQDGVHSEKLWASDGTGARKFLFESETAKTFGYSVFFDRYTDPAELAAKYVCRVYIRLITPEGEVITAYMNASTMNTGSSVSFYDVVKLLNTKVDEYIENQKFIDIIENIYTPHHFYVDTVNGNDANDGKSASTAFKTIEAATETAIRLINLGVPVDVTIHFPAGTTYVDHAIELSGKDITGTVYKINYVGHEDGTTISGTTTVAGSDFTEYKDGIYVYELPDALKGTQLRTLYANGKMATLARNDWHLTKVDECSYIDPKTGERYWLMFVEPSALEGLVESVTDPATGKVTYRLVDEFADQSMEWHCVLKFYLACLRVELIDLERSNTTLTGMQVPQLNSSALNTVNVNVEGYIALRMHIDDGELFRQHHTHLGLLSDPGAHNAKPGFDYILMNNLAFLDEPGEFYYDEANGLIYYMPEEGQTMADIPFDIPLCEQLFVLEDFNYATFENLTFTGLTSNLVTNYGHMSGQAGQNRIGFDDFSEFSWIDHAAIVARDIKGLTVKNCDFSQLPYYGLYLAKGIEEVTVVDCNFDRIGSSAIAAPTTVKNVLVENNYFHNIAEDFYNAVAIFFMHAKDLDILHNTIVNCAYSAVSVGWTWKWHDGDAENINITNVEVAYNYIENALYFTFDGGAIYFNGGSTVISDPVLNSAIHHNYHYNLSREGHTLPGNAEVGSKNTSWYLDGSCSHVYVYDNVVYINEDEKYTSKYSYISIQGGDGWTYNPENFNIGGQSYRITCENNYFINLYQDYLTTGYGRIKAMFYLYEFNSVIFTKRDPQEVAMELQELYDREGLTVHGEKMQKYMLIDPDSFEQVLADLTAALEAYAIIDGAGCTSDGDRPLAHADSVDLFDYYQKSVTNYKDTENDKTMHEDTYVDGDNVYSRDWFH